MMTEMYSTNVSCRSSKSEQACWTHQTPFLKRITAGGIDYIIDIKYPQHASTNLLHISALYVQRRWAILHNNDGDEIE